MGAVLLDEESAEAHTSLAHVNVFQDWDWPGAEREFLRALSLNPRYATAHHWYAMSCHYKFVKLNQKHHTTVNVACCSMDLK